MPVCVAPAGRRTQTAQDPERLHPTRRLARPPVGLWSAAHMRQHLIAVLCCLGLLLPAGDAPPAVVSLRLNVLLTDSEVFKPLMLANQREQQAFQAEAARINDAAKVKHTQLNLAEPNSPTAIRLKGELEQLSFSFKQLDNTASEMLQRRRAALLRYGLPLVQSHLAVYAKEHGHSLVILAEEFAPLQRARDQDIREFVNSVKFLYADPAIDITPAFKAYFAARTAGLDFMAMVSASASASATATPAPASASAATGVP